MGRLLLWIRQFQFTHPGRGATEIALCQAVRHQVSIHAPREGCDVFFFSLVWAKKSFNSRTPGGVRRGIGKYILPIKSFNSRTPGGVRRIHAKSKEQAKVSIHAPREGCDHCPKARSRYSYCFNSRTPGGVRLYFPYPHRSKWQVSIHAPREGCDVGVVARPVEVEVSIHAPREGCDRPLADEVVLLTVSIHAPREGCDRSMTSRPLRSPSFNSRTPGGVRRRRLP